MILIDHVESFPKNWMPALTSEEQNRIQNACRGQVFITLNKIVSSTIVRLYEARNHQQYTHLVTGGLALVRKRTGGFSFAVIDPSVLIY